jgi:hypothetical protein
MLPDPTPDMSAAASASLPSEPVVPVAPPAPVAAAAPRFVPKPTGEPARSRGAASGSPVDELAFLKSVGAESSGGGSAGHAPAGRRSGETQRVDIPAAEPAGSAPAGKSQAKTLKCGECGTLNRPTEWYCERCGAELAAV